MRKDRFNVMVARFEEIPMHKLKEGDVFYVAAPKELNYHAGKWLIAKSNGKLLNRSGLCEIHVNQLHEGPYDEIEKSNG